MMKHMLTFLVGLGLFGQGLFEQALASDEIEFSPLEGSIYEASGQGVVQMLCQNTETGIYYLSRAVVLEFPGSDRPYDILLAARHAVMDTDGTRQCQIRGEGAEGGHISTIIRSIDGPQFSTDFANDWAVLQTTERLSADLVRARAAIYNGEENGQLSIMSRAVELAPCGVTGAPEDMESSTLIFHDCETRPGMSGSPMMTMIDGQPYVVGVHVGHIMMMNEDFRRYGVARRLNGDFLNALLKLTSVNTLKED